MSKKTQEKQSLTIKNVETISPQNSCIAMKLKFIQYFEIIEGDTHKTLVQRARKFKMPYEAFAKDHGYHLNILYLYTSSKLNYFYGRFLVVLAKCAINSSSSSTWEKQIEASNGLLRTLSKELPASVTVF